MVNLWFILLVQLKLNAFYSTKIHQRSFGKPQNGIGRYSRQREWKRSTFWCCICSFFLKVADLCRDTCRLWLHMQTLLQSITFLNIGASFRRTTSVPPVTISPPSPPLPLQSADHKNKTLLIILGTFIDDGRSDWSLSSSMILYFRDSTLVWFYMT